MEVGKTVWDETARRSIKPDVKRLRAAIEEAKQKGVAVVKRVEREYESYELYYKQMPLAARQGKADWMKVVITISYPSLSVQIGSPFKTDTIPEGYKRQGEGGDARYIAISEPATTSPAVEPTSKAAATTTATEVPAEVRQIFDTLDLPQGKKSKTRKIVEAMHPDLGKKAIFVNDNIEQIIAEAEANGKVTKECP